MYVVELAPFRMTLYPVPEVVKEVTPWDCEGACDTKRCSYKKAIDLELRDHGNCRIMYTEMDRSFKYYSDKLSIGSNACSYLMLHLMLHYKCIIEETKNSRNGINDIHIVMCDSQWQIYRIYLKCVSTCW